MQVIDFYQRQPRSWLEQVHRDDSGIKGIARYLTNNPADPKCFSPAERDDAFAVGLDVHLVYETTGGSMHFPPGGAAYFTGMQGIYDATQAIARLHELQAPAGTVVYFAVDVNIPGWDVVPYFNQIDRLVPAAGYAPGVYGYQGVVEFFRAGAGLTGKHLWQTYGAPQGPLDLCQHEQKPLGSVTVDVNEASIFGWRKGVDNTPQRMGQSAGMVDARAGDLVELQSIYVYPATHPEGRALLTKFRAGSRPGPRVVIVYPPVDPDADATQVLDAEPCLFVINVLG